MADIDAVKIEGADFPQNFIFSQGGKATETAVTVEHGALKDCTETQDNNQN